MIAKYGFETTIVDGGRVLTTPNIQGILRAIRCIFETLSTTFVLAIDDNNGVPVYKSETETGALVNQLALPVKGIYTITFSDVSKNEDFELKLEVEEG